MNVSNWSSFWKRPTTAFDRVMRVSTEFFARRFQREFSPGPGDFILDYGCGPGFLIEQLVPTGATIAGADINTFFLEQNKARFPGIRFVAVSEDASDTSRILSQQLGDMKFDYVVLLSIVQYFKSHADVADVVGVLTRYLKPGGKIILADVLLENTSAVRDAFGILAECLRRGRVIAFARFILYLTFSDYRNISRRNELLPLPSRIAEKIAQDNDMLLSRIGGLTPHPTRTNYVFTLSRDKNE